MLRSMLVPALSHSDIYELGPIRAIKNMNLHNFKQENIPRNSMRWKEYKDSFSLSIAMPGFAPDDISIEIEDKIIEIKAQASKSSDNEENKDDSKQNNDISNDNWHFFSENVWRALIPKNANVDKIDATLRRGVLNLTIQKVEKTEPKKITIREIVE